MLNNYLIDIYLCRGSGHAWNLLNFQSFFSSVRDQKKYFSRNISVSFTHLQFDYGL